MKLYSLLMPSVCMTQTSDNPQSPHIWKNVQLLTVHCLTSSCAWFLESENRSMYEQGGHWMAGVTSLNFISYLLAFNKTSKVCIFETHYNPAICLHPFSVCRSINEHVCTLWTAFWGSINSQTHMIDSNNLFDFWILILE